MSARRPKGTTPPIPRRPTAAKLTPLTPHDLRHTAASLFISAGANPWMLTEILGHSDTRMIDRIDGRRGRPEER